MASADRSEYEDNDENLPGRQAVRKMKEMLESEQNRLLRSAIALDDSNGDRPMTVRQLPDRHTQGHVRGKLDV